MTDLLALSARLPLLEIAPSETLIDEGSRTTRMYVLQEGVVVIEHDGLPFARVDTPGAVFGEMAAVLDKPATATVRAVGDVRVRVVEDPTAFLTREPGAALAVLRTTASRLDGLTQYLVDVKQQFAGEEGHLGMVDQILDHLVHHQGPAARTGSARDPEGDHDHSAEAHGL
jgi:CRP-like cAMP-binding protein